MSPRPLAPSRGGPSPRSRCTVPCLVAAGTRIRLVPFRVGTSTVAPRMASTMVMGTSTSRSSPLRLNTGDSSTRVTTYRSPAAPARLSLAGEADPAAVAYAGGDVGLVALGLAGLAASLAARARIVDLGPGTTALRTRLGDGEKALALR